MEVSAKTTLEIEEGQEKEDLKKLEAIFFISGRFLTMQELVTLSDLNPVMIGELLDKLKSKYEKMDSALELVSRPGLWKMDVRQEYAGIINRLATGSAEFTKAEQETLAIIAYKQPIKQSVITKIRGNKSYDHLKKFEDLGLIKRKKEGHTNILTLSEEFYDYFSVADGASPFDRDRDSHVLENDSDDEVDTYNSEEENSGEGESPNIDSAEVKDVDDNLDEDLEDEALIDASGEAKEGEGQRDGKN